MSGRLVAGIYTFSVVADAHAPDACTPIDGAAVAAAIAAVDALVESSGTGHIATGQR
ncbi:hypothetical protein D3C80_1677700 [compost metagenome]